jgi:D-aminopeptidase
MMQGIDSSFAAVAFVGYHASEGEANAILAHTESGSTIFEVKLNGVTVPEAGINAAIAGDFGVPVVFLSAIRRSARRRGSCPIEVAAVKTAGGFSPEPCSIPRSARGAFGRA